MLRRAIYCSSSPFVGPIHAVRQVLLEPLIGGADTGETLRRPDLHLVNLLEGQDRFHDVVEGAARHHVDVMDKRVGRGMHPAKHLHQRPKGGKIGEAPATARLIYFQTFERPEALTKELDHEEHRNSAPQPVPEDRDLVASLHVQITQLLGDLLEHHGRRLEDAFVDLSVKQEDTQDVDVREGTLNFSTAAGVQHNLVRLQVDAEEKVRRTKGCKSASRR